MVRATGGVLFLGLLFLGSLLVTSPGVAADPIPASSADSPRLSGIRQGALAAYVAKADASYRWVPRRAGTIGLGKYAELTLTSQTWKDIVWKHQLFLIRPSRVPRDNRHALLFITGGSWRGELEDADRPENLPREATALALLAESLKTPVAVLRQVPHQPILGDKYEDQIIAHTFQQFMETGDPEWPLLLPMVKTAVRAMDATGEYCGREWSLPVETFTVTGASKRGWTTWLTAAVDPRVKALAPMVIDMLNLQRQMDHQRQAWGELSSEIDDYSRLKLDQHLETPRGRALQAIVDPYLYRDALQQPKLIMLGTNDAYWPLDALNLYWDGLRGPKYILYVPNNGHGLNDMPRLLGGINALHHHAQGGFRLPVLSWDFHNGDGQLTLRVRSDEAPRQVQAWVARSASRDFRQARWEALPTESRDGAHVYHLELPRSGYAALFGEARFDGPGLPYYLSTNVQLVGPGLSNAVKPPRE